MYFAATTSGSNCHPSWCPGYFDWLGHHAKLHVWPNNWLLFSAVISGFPESVGADAPDGAAAVHRVESCCLADGWYTDGWTRDIDHSRPCRAE